MADDKTWWVDWGSCATWKGEKSDSERRVEISWRRKEVCNKLKVRTHIPKLADTSVLLRKFVDHGP